MHAHSHESVLIKMRDVLINTDPWEWAVRRFYFKIWSSGEHVGVEIIL